MKRQFIVTYTGKKFFFDDITPEQIDIKDIAHALSMLCRFTGHIHQFYSVAQHSLLVDSQINGPSNLHLAVLLHDAAEAYVNDLASPLKRWMNHRRGVPVSTCLTTWTYKGLHDQILKAIYQKFGVFVNRGDQFTVKRVDAEACVFEAEAFLGLTPQTMECHGFDPGLCGTFTVGPPRKYAEKHGDRSRKNVERDFLVRFHELWMQREYPT
jgi:hypothetical protein